MNPRGNPATLVEARRRDSLDKRQRVLDAVATLEHAGHKITHAAVARTAGVSTWLTYTDGVREHIEAAQRRRLPAPRTSPENAPTAAALRAELDLARQEIRQLRGERDKMRGAIRHQLGQQLDALGTQDLTARIDELTHHNQQLADQLQQATAQSTALQDRVTSLEDDLTAARTSLRRMIRAENIRNDSRTE